MTFYVRERRFRRSNAGGKNDQRLTTAFHIPGKSKIDHETATELSTMPVGSKLSSLILSSDDCHLVDSFVAMALSKDGESVEVKYIIKKTFFLYKL